MAKLKISTYFPHIFSKLSSNFLQLFQMTKLDCFQTGQRTFARTLWRSKPLFARMNSCCAINAWYSGCTASASTKETASAVWHTNAFILSGYKGVWCQVSFFVATPERNATATQKEALWWDCFWRHRLKTNRWPARRTLCQLILPPPWKQTYSRKMFSFKAQNTAGTKLLPERDGLRQHVRAWGETIFLLHCRLIQMASANRLDQTGSTKLAGHQNSLLLRVRLAGKKIAVAVRPHCLDKPDTQE